MRASGFLDLLYVYVRACLHVTESPEVPRSNGKLKKFADKMGLDRYFDNLSNTGVDHLDINNLRWRTHSDTTWDTAGIGGQQGLATGIV